ncbi:MAG TPA: UDP-N-acetylmuramoyl-L-alanine--D-glutamate ligase [Candidatus Dormibacteraeota bacterium]|nr:UDP-N-acetylmuramoyl-L-alanine--D-glutamate ligase [Candidatus Dormibacteraeota bacterium]
MSELAGTRAMVIGAGRAGRSCARLLAARGAQVRVVEREPAAARDAEWPDGVELLLGTEQPAALDGITLLVPSPGVPHDHALLAAAVVRGVPVWSEIELAARFLACPVLAITGTNGKSTTTTLLGAMLQAAGQRVFVGGNLGTPLADAALDPAPWDAAVAEVSSFQLEWVPSFAPRVAVLLNLTPDHQDRYPNPADYGAAKANILRHQASGDVAVLNRDDPWVWEQRHRTRATVLSFGREPVEFGTYLDGDDAVVWSPSPQPSPAKSAAEGAGQPQRYDLSTSPLAGAHNRENLLAALTAATAWGTPPDAIRAAIRTTTALPHRLELVGERAGVRWYDDSKATNVGAVEKSIDSFPGGIVLLLGGYDKGGDFAVLRRRLAARVARTICFGKAGPEIAAQLGAAAAPVVVSDLAAAVRAAAAARPGQVVVLAPGCASFDEFRNYAERGQRFRALVEDL